MAKRGDSFCQQKVLLVWKEEKKMQSSSHIRRHFEKSNLVIVKIAQHSNISSKKQVKSKGFVNLKVNMM